MDKFEDKLAAIKKDIQQTWDAELIPLLSEYIKIPNKSPAFDSKWEQHGYMQQALDLIYNWCLKRAIKGMQCKVMRLPHRTPLLYIEIPGQIDETVVLYGHMDKQPEMVGWDKDKGPWKPVIQDNKLYGRGGADDGYSTFASLFAIELLQRYEIPHARCVVIIEGSEESGSQDLPYYLKELESQIGNPNFVICLDSGCGNYEQMWSMTSLRGLMGGVLEIEVLSSGIHSGFGSGVVPSVMMVLQQLLDRIEDRQTGELRLPEFKAQIPDLFKKQAHIATGILKEAFLKAYPFPEGVKPISDDPVQLLLNRTWGSFLAVTGIEGYPALENAGNVTLPKGKFSLSLRIAPTLKTDKLMQLLKETLERDPPFNAKVTFTPSENSDGWQAPELAPWLEKANHLASQRFFGKDAVYTGEGGIIPFMGMLGKKFPSAQFLITGILGPHSNAHGPNEFLHIPMVKGITGCVASVLASHYDHYKNK